MVKNYAKNKGRGKGQFVMLRYDMIDSNAWQNLSTSARAIWIEIMRRYNGYNNGEIPLSCREAAELCNIGKTTASRHFKELQEKGFIKIGSFGGFRVKKRYSTRWIITHESCDDKKPTNEWKGWMQKE